MYLLPTRIPECEIQYFMCPVTMSIQAPDPFPAGPEPREPAHLFPVPFFLQWVELCSSAYQQFCQ